MTLARLDRRTVAKPWGRTDLPAAFGPVAEPIGEVWFGDDHNVPPLLAKWLFTADRLSVQVHPDDVQAAARGLPSGKEECWVVVAAEPGARLGIGTRTSMGAEALRTASLSGKIATLLDWKPVAAGDWFHIAPGTVHAIGAGVTLIEVQQHADVTYRLYDYGRPRPLHLDDGVAVSRAEPYRDPRHGRLGTPGKPVLLSRCDSFALHHGGGATLDLLPDAELLLIPIAGQIMVADGIAAAGSVLYGRCNAEQVSDDFAYLAAVPTSQDS